MDKIISKQPPIKPGIPRQPMQRIKNKRYIRMASAYSILLKEREANTVAAA